MFKLIGVLVIALVVGVVPKAIAGGRHQGGAELRPGADPGAPGGAVPGRGPLHRARDAQLPPREVFALAVEPTRPTTW